MGARIYLGNLPFTAREAELRALLEAQGCAVQEIKLVHDQRTGRPLGFGFAELATDDDAARAVSALKGYALAGRPLRVELAQEPVVSRKS